MLPIGNRATGRIGSHAKWRGLEHACHLHIGRTSIGNRRVALARLRRGRRIFRRIAQDRLAHGFVLVLGGAGYGMTSKLPPVVMIRNGQVLSSLSTTKRQADARALSCW